MRPDAFYELTSGCELTFADVKCLYFIGPPPDLVKLDDEEEGSSCEQTQAYGLVQGEEETDEEVNENPLPVIGIAYQLDLNQGHSFS